jgi:hypothetical protein
MGDGLTCLVDTDIMIDVSRGHEAAADLVDSLENPTISIVTAQELIFNDRGSAAIGLNQEGSTARKSTWQSWRRWVSPPTPRTSSDHPDRIPGGNAPEQGVDFSALRFPAGA